ncbi:RNA methyltransferase [Alteromonas sp. CYL-A6]|uniref:RNA methyltransferase n=1 Tax=Alteromonas nitratireducens TaxID=3390813 RepID=UPI0034A707F5
MSAKQTITLGLINPKSAVNVAGILRAAGCYGVDTVLYTGQRYRYAKEFNADTKAFHRQIPTIGVDDLFEMAPSSARRVAIELVEDATPLPHYTHPANAMYILGPEDGSIGDDILRQCDDVVYVPTRSCMNLAATVNVVLYDRLSKSDFVHNNAVIRQSRDNNNNARR